MSKEMLRSSIAIPLLFLIGLLEGWRPFRGVLGRAVEKMRPEALRIFLASAEEVLGILRDHTDWDGQKQE